MSEEMQKTHRGRTSLFGPLLLIGLGVVFLLNNLGVLPGSAWDLVLKLWPLLLIFGGLDGLFKREGVAGPAFAIGLGIVFLLANLGYLAVDVWRLVLHLWPVLIIAAGFDLLFGRRSVWMSLVGLGAVIAILLGALWVYGVRVEGGSALTGQEISQSIGAATQARLTLDPGAGSLNVSAMQGGEQLITGRIGEISGMKTIEDFSQDGSTAVYSLRHSGSASFRSDFTGRAWDWDLQLTPSLPMDLSVNLGAGSGHFDLRGLDLSSLQIDLGVGQVVVTLPATGQFDGSVSGGMGELLIRVPRGAAVRIQADLGLAARSFPTGYARSGDTYTSPGYESASQRINLNLDMGMGSVRVEEIAP